MPTIDEMSLDEIDAYMAQLRDRKRVLKRSGKTATRKIATLERRRDRFMAQVRQIEEQIEALRREANVVPAPAPRRRGRRPKSASATS